MIQEKLKILPKLPGCYLMKNKLGTVIYVGKAKNLKNRVVSYFRGTHFGKTKKLVSEIHDFDYIVVESELESLILELNLIKKYDPKYNILLRDDKSYPYIELTKERAARLRIIRTLNKKRDKFKRIFGPYPNVTAARETVNLLNRIYPLRKCRVYPKKPCLYYHINQCLGYCVYDIDKSVTDNIEEEIVSFLKGNTNDVVQKVKLEMELESKNLNFEEALNLKKILESIESTVKSQTVEINDLIDKDVIGIHRDNLYISINIFFIRGGKIVSMHSKIIDHINDYDEEIETYLAAFYEKNTIPREIIIDFESSLLSDYLETKIITPKRGTKKELLDLSIKNAKENLDKEIILIKNNEKRTIDANELLREMLGLDQLEIIETFDNSTLFKTFTVSALVVFKNGLPSKKNYRKYKIQGEFKDDYSSMREVAYRRYFRLLKDKGVLPDLIIVDGGINQINAFKSVLDDFYLDIKVVGIKKNKKHKMDSLINTDGEEIIIKNNDVYHYLERINEEVHRFVINYHRQIRSKGFLESALDNVDGLGKIRREALLTEYPTIKDIKEAKREDLEKILPVNVVNNLIEKINKE